MQRARPWPRRLTIASPNPVGPTNRSAVSIDRIWSYSAFGSVEKSTQEVVDHLTLDVGETHVTATESERKSFVIDA